MAELDGDPLQLGHLFHGIVAAFTAEPTGCFTVCACTFLDAADVPPDFPHRETMNIGYAKGGSQIVNPLGVVMAGPAEGSQLLYADWPPWMIKAVKAIVDTAGHHSRPDAVSVMLNSPAGWKPVGTPYESGPSRAPSLHDLPLSELRRSADLRETSMEDVE